MTYKVICTSVSEKAGESYLQLTVGDTTYYGKKVRCGFRWTAYPHKSIDVKIIQSTANEMLFFDDGTQSKTISTDGEGDMYFNLFFGKSGSVPTSSFRKTGVKLRFTLPDSIVYDLTTDCVHFHFDLNGDVQGVTIADKFDVETLSTSSGLISVDTTGTWSSTLYDSEYINGKARHIDLTDYYHYFTASISPVSGRYIFIHFNKICDPGAGRGIYLYYSRYYLGIDDDAFTACPGMTSAATYNICSTRFITFYGVWPNGGAYIHNVYAFDF